MYASVKLSLAHSRFPYCFGNKDVIYHLLFIHSTVCGKNVLQLMFYVVVICSIKLYIDLYTYKLTLFVGLGSPRLCSTLG